MTNVLCRKQDYAVADGACMGYLPDREVLRMHLKTVVCLLLTRPATIALAA